MENKLKEVEYDLKEITKLVYRLAESQNITVKNIDLMTKDIKDILKATSRQNIFDARLDAVEARLDKTDAVKLWIAKIVGGILLGALMTLVLKGGVV